MAKRTKPREGNKAASWRRHVRGQADGKVSIRAYCAANGLREYSFYWWRRELARRDAARPAEFVLVAVTQEMPAPALAGAVEIVLPGDRRVRVQGPVDRQMLADVLAVLTAREGDAPC